MSQEVTYESHDTSTLHTFENQERDMVETATDNQATVRMDKILKCLIEDWLKTDDAKKKGYNSLAQFINKGARNLYEIESTPDEIPTHFVLPNMQNHRLTLDMDIFSNKVHCNMCDSHTCIHVEILHTDATVKKFLKKYKIKSKK